MINLIPYAQPQASYGQYFKSPTPPASYSYPPPASYSYPPPASYSYPKPASPPVYAPAVVSKPPVAATPTAYPAVYNPYPQVPYAPVSYSPQANYPYATQYNPYPANNYGNEYENCTDLSCKPNECCEFNGKRYVCVNQEDSVTNTLIAEYCQRAKRCHSNGDCPVNHCCVIRLDMPYDASSYGSYGNDMYGGYKRERGECIISAAVNSTCRKAVDVSTSACPCTASTCVFTPGNPVTGVCKIVTG